MMFYLLSILFIVKKANSHSLFDSTTFGVGKTLNRGSNSNQNSDHDLLLLIQNEIDNLHKYKPQLNIFDETDEGQYWSKTSKDFLLALNAAFHQSFHNLTLIMKEWESLSIEDSQDIVIGKDDKQKVQFPSVDESLSLGNFSKVRKIYASC